MNGETKTKTSAINSYVLSRDIGGMCRVIILLQMPTSGDDGKFERHAREKETGGY